MKATVERFRNCGTGQEWAANPGSEAHKRMVAGVGRGEFERIEEPKRRARTKSDEE